MPIVRVRAAGPEASQMSAMSSLSVGPVSRSASLSRHRRRRISRPDTCRPRQPIRNAESARRRTRASATIGGDNWPSCQTGRAGVCGDQFKVAGRSHLQLGSRRISGSERPRATIEGMNGLPAGSRTRISFTALATDSSLTRKQPGTFTGPRTGDYLSTASSTKAETRPIIEGGVREKRARLLINEKTVPAPQRGKVAWEGDNDVGQAGRKAPCGCTS